MIVAYSSGMKLFINFFLFTFIIFIPNVSISESLEVNGSSKLEKLIEDRKYDEALNYIENIEPQKDKYNFYKVSAEFFMRAGKFLKAIDFFKLAYINANNQKEKDYTLLRRGECYLRLNYYDEAYLVLTNLVKNSPNSIYLNDAYLLLAQSCEALGKIEDAFKYFQKVPPTLSSQIIKAKAFVRMKKYEEGVKIFENMIKTEKNFLANNLDVYYYHGEALRNLNRLREAKIYLSGAKKLSNYKDLASLSLGLISYKEKDYSLAIEYFNEVMKGNDRNAKAEALYYLGKINYERGLKKEAKVMFINLRNNFPTSKEYAQATKYLMTIAREDKDYESIYKYLNEIAITSKLDMDLIDELEMITLELYETNKEELKKFFDKYGNYLLKAKKINTLLKISNAFGDDKQLKILNYVFLTSLGEEKKKSANLLFNYYVKKGDVDRALKYENYVDRNLVEKLKIYDYLIDGNYEKVSSIILNAKDVSSDDLNLLIYVFEKVKNKKKVLDFLSRAIDKNNLDPEIYVKLGDFFSEKDKKLSIKSYNKVLSLKNIKQDLKESIQQKIFALEKNEKIDVVRKYDGFEKEISKSKEVEKRIEKIIREFNI